ncbi:hypothetical protein BDR26DRAFT_946826 [Obelidium mucronatum]|nr:hypothetical protein BDR26DRAFT_946826 [Obelidium mucronatum]
MNSQAINPRSESSPRPTSSTKAINSPPAADDMIADSPFTATNPIPPPNFTLTTTMAKFPSFIKISVPPNLTKTEAIETILSQSRTKLFEQYLTHQAPPPNADFQTIPTVTVLQAALQIALQAARQAARQAALQTALLSQPSRTADSPLLVTEIVPAHQAQLHETLA